VADLVKKKEVADEKTAQYIMLFSFTLLLFCGSCSINCELNLKISF
jgi:hypothetical protein